MKRISYLAYGSNLHPFRLVQRVSSAHLIGTVALPDWSLQFNKIGQDGSGKCNITHLPGASAQAYGAVFSIDEDQKAILDHYEGAGKGYKVSTLTVQIDHQEINVFCYLAEPAYIKEQIQPFSWYRELVCAGAWFHGFPEDYVAGICSGESVVDSDQSRCAENRLLLRAMKAL